MENSIMDDKRPMKASYHQIDPEVVRRALAFYLAGAGGLCLKEIPKQFMNRDFLDSLINEKVAVTGEFGIARMAAMVKTMLLHLFMIEMGVNHVDATTNAVLVCNSVVEQLTRFLRTPEK